MKLKYIFSIIGLLLLISCGNFLEEQSSDLRYAISCEDLNELLVGGAYMKHVSNADGKAYNLIVKGDNAEYFPWIHVIDDDAEEVVKGGIESGTESPRSLVGSFYYWDKDPFNMKGVFYDDNVWNRLYTHIGVVNVVLEKADEFMNDPEELRNRVKGEAYFLRAAYYFLLVNFYAKPYSEISSSTDLGVPLKVYSHIEDKNWKRSPVDSVYSQVVADLNTAIKCFEGLPVKSVNRASEASALALLSRVYCYMGKWELVPELCDRVMEMGYSLVELNGHPILDKPLENSFNSQKSPELIFTQGSCCINELFTTTLNNCRLYFGPSAELLESFDENDLRLQAFFIPSKASGATHVPVKYKPSRVTTNKMATGGMVSDVYLIRLAEIYLNKAEALAMQGKDAEARLVLQDLRKKRFKPENLTSLDQYSGEKLVEFIREERRRELCFEGHRWFDLRRYAVCPKYPMAKEIYHPHYDPPMTTGANMNGRLVGYYHLPKYPDGNWVLPIPGYEIEQNNGAMINNERMESKYMEL
ncbi:RagB/SusD family nutrient uptake outer membrane protein [Butyricimonas virosa]|uniref:RagB/SusD family nutrient uptake outer membrane protein n=3 Tax=Butyricimonas virosa TaxID=544645 RepID=A0A412WY93_9BACT|nr:RagB/SusD family nutrient uptake outer membrane protein [Butyricimonas virosa]MBR5461699.1 RagB/SusD family nutrient uptake outer membrane protein [Butyricimonas sp.]MDY4905487.1 RagB/SusD family nutrient uptake outer membrane protein [Butyricimonas virosa]RGV32625.1 RagB/SusD family nutrient uptake outer membrane protein [Butyricimonas virosa]